MADCHDAVRKMVLAGGPANVTGRERYGVIPDEVIATPSAVSASPTLPSIRWA